MKLLLTVTTAAALVEGLWSHDWRLLLAGAACALIWPLISTEVSR